jgi:hypothetical protein
MQLSRVCSFVHFQLHLDVRDHPGQVHAKQTCQTSVCIPPVSHQEQDHQRPGALY